MVRNRRFLAAALVGSIGGCVHAPAQIAPRPVLEAAIASIEIPADAGVLVGSGDIADCDEPEGAAATGDLIHAVLERHPAAVVFTTGDHAYPNGTAEEFRNCYAPHWGSFSARTAPTPGNHDYQTPGAAGYFDYFEVFDARPGARPTSYYSFELATWRIAVLNSLLHVDRDAVQVRWLETLLADEAPECLLATWHHPRRSSGFHGYSPWDEGRDTGPFWNVLVRHGADVVLNGHDHLYERFAKLDSEGRPDQAGIRQFTVGTGGAGLHPIIRQRAGSDYLSNEVYGVLVLMLHPGSYEWAFVGVDGVVHDRSEEPATC